MDIFKNKLILSILIILSVLVLFVVSIKIININSQNCETDTDCTFYERSCCYSCGYGDSVNKNFLTTLGIDKSISCIVGLRSIACPMYDCMLMAPQEPFCNQNNKCDTKVDCEKTCEMWINRLENMPEEQQRIQKWISVNTDCSCDFN